MGTVREAWHAAVPLVMSALATAPSCARQLGRAQLAEWGLSRLSDTADLVITELVTNAVRACAGRGQPAQLAVCLSVCGHRVRIEVWDPDPSLPRRADVAPLAESGRGLHLVDAMSGGRWGAIPCPEGGKITWAELAPPLPAPAPATKRARDTRASTSVARWLRRGGPPSCT